MGDPAHRPVGPRQAREQGTRKYLLNLKDVDTEALCAGEAEEQQLEPVVPGESGPLIDAVEYAGHR